MNEPSSNNRKSYQKAYRQKYRHLVKRVNCTLTLDEYEELAKRASKAGFKITPYFKKAAIADTNQEYIVPHRVEEELREVIWLIRNIGNSMNQLAARANTLKKTTVLDLMKAKRNIHDLETTIKKFVCNPPKQRQSDDSKIDEQKIGKLRTVN